MGLQPAVRGHILKLCIYHKHYTTIYEVMYIPYLKLFFHVRPAKGTTIRQELLHCLNAGSPCAERIELYLWFVR